MQISTLPPPIKASEIPFENLAANKNISEAEKVAEACKQFEAVLLRQILKEARKDVMGSKLSGTSSSSEIYNDMITDQLAGSISRSGSFGLAQSLKKQLVHQISHSAGEGSQRVGEADAFSASCASDPLNRLAGRMPAEADSKAAPASYSHSRKKYD